MVTTHPNDEILQSYVNGSLSGGMEMFVKGHLHYCPQCRNKVELLEMIAGELLTESREMAEVDSAAFETVLKRLPGAQERSSSFAL